MENHGQAYTPNGDLRTNLWDGLTSKLDGYSTGWSSPPTGVKPVHDENCLGIKLRQRRIKSAHPCIYPKAAWNALT